MCQITNQANINGTNVPINPISITVSRNPKLFLKKYGYWDGDDNNSPLEKGKDLGFTLVFGNYEEDTPSATIKDTLIVPDTVILKVMSLSLADNFILTYQAKYGTDLAEHLLKKGTLLPANEYTIRVKPALPPTPPNTDPGFAPGEVSISIPEHTVYCISMLFQVED